MVPKFSRAKAPVAKTQDHTDTHHGITRNDEYAWMRADNWQDVFRDPKVLDPEIRAHLDAENGYSKKADGYRWYRFKMNSKNYYIASKYLKKA